MGKKAPARLVPVQPRKKPKVGRDLAIKIGTVYTQRLLQEHGIARHYHDMDEVRCDLKPGARGQQADRPPPR